MSRCRRSASNSPPELTLQIAAAPQRVLHDKISWLILLRINLFAHLRRLIWQRCKFNVAIAAKAHAIGHDSFNDDIAYAVARLYDTSVEHGDASFARKEDRGYARA